MLRGWNDKGRNLYEIEIEWNKHKGIVEESELVTTGDYSPPYWCREVINQRRDQLYVRLAPFTSVSDILNTLIGFTKNMGRYGKHKLHIYAMNDKACDFRSRFTIEFDSRLSYYANGERSNRKAVIEILEELKTD